MTSTPNSRLIKISKVLARVETAENKTAVLTQQLETIVNLTTALANHMEKVQKKIRILSILVVISLLSNVIFWYV